MKAFGGMPVRGERPDIATVFLERFEPMVKMTVSRLDHISMGQATTTNSTLLNQDVPERLRPRSDREVTERRAVLITWSFPVLADSRLPTGFTGYGFREGAGGDTPAPIRTDAQANIAHAGWGRGSSPPPSPNWV